MGTFGSNTFHLRTKGGKRRQKSSTSGILPRKQKQKPQELSDVHRLREMDVDDKVCEQVDMELLAQVYPKEER